MKDSDIIIDNHQILITVKYSEEWDKLSDLIRKL